jgi:hypothetical protein
MMVYRLLLPRGCVICFDIGGIEEPNEGRLFVSKVNRTGVRELRAGVKLLQVHSTFQELVSFVYRDMEFRLLNLTEASS